MPPIQSQPTSYSHRADADQRQRPPSPCTNEAAQLAHALYRALLPATPKRAALMSASGARKYSDAPKGHLFSPDDLRDHLAGRRTWATTLADGVGLAVAGCRDYDQGGEAVIDAALAAAQAVGVVAFGIILEGAEGEHSGGHVWAFYRERVPAIDIRAQLGTLPGEQGEIYPSGNCVRLPLGLHRHKGTRGTLLLQDGRRFALDRPDELGAGLRVILALRRNAQPPAAPPTARTSSGGSFGIHYNPADWLNLPDGAALMASPRYQALFRNRPQLATLQRGARVALQCDGALDDTGSAQVAVLVSNLLTTCGKGQQPGQGAPPLAEIRAIALHWKPALRDNRTLEHYQAHVDAEIARYTPPNYDPAPTAYVRDQAAPTPQPLTAPQHRGPGRPAGQRLHQAQRLVELVATLPADTAGFIDTTRTLLAAALALGPDMVSKLLADGRAGGRLETRQRQHGIAVRLVINPPQRDAAEACNPSCQDRVTTPKIAPVSCMESHSAPPCPPVAAVVPPEAPSELVGGADEAPQRGTGGGLCASLSAEPPVSAPTSSPAAAAPVEPIASASDEGAGNTGGAVCASLSAEPSASTLTSAVALPPELVRMLHALEQVPRQYANPTTGQLGKVTVQRVGAYLGVEPDAALRRELFNARHYRREVALSAWLAAPTTTSAMLKAEIRKAEHQADRSVEQGGADAAYWRYRADRCRLELAKRPPASERPAKRGGPVKPNQRAAGARYQASLWEVADAALETMREVRAA